MTELQIFSEALLQALAAGLLVGGLYGLMCLGLAMIFSIMRVINFAQGDFMMLGMYVAYFFFMLLGTQSVLGPYVSILLTVPIMFMAGYLVHYFLISKVTGSRTASLEGEGHYAQLVLTLGLALILQNGGMMLFGSQLVSIRTPLSSSAWEVGPMWGDFVSIFINKGRGVAAIISLLVIVLFTLLVHRTRLGKSLRAAADNPVASSYMGIDVNRAYRIAFALGTCITALAGGLLATNYPFHPFVGLEFVIIMYAGVVLGGMGSILGAFWGGMAIGLVQQLSSLVLPTQLQNAAIFVFFLLIVTLRPQGLFGRVSERT
ncbi:MAG: branched-chain amino acid ABC transporter permease [Pollutimonas bauzanensis]|uniref:Branched-chain amino acid transport system permease protein n=1 Tax=Pollutimonas bauzanensis TaxID=658167 RepID=A0A1M5THN0_9BURK|nr:branched-chain amino acid ABC transporter permease [Pollutimonas bauzanensis]SHH50199.1 branched-chain amino acid transport system permease protein [Pollutimonas bauzanensis]